LIDKRSIEEVEYLIKTIVQKTLYTSTGNPVFTGFLLPSLLWVKKHEPDIYKKIYKVSSPKDYLALKLTGNLLCEPTDALATAAFDYKKNDWSAKVLKTCKIPISIFPSLIKTDQSYGGISKRVAHITGLPIGTPVFGGSDQSMAALGNGLIHKGDVAIAISTGGQFLVVGESGHIDPKRRLHTLNHAISDIGLYMAATLSAGFSLRWFKDEITGFKDITNPKFLEHIKDIPPGSDGLMFMPFLAGERTPYFNPNLRGAFIGLSHAHSRAHLIRAIIEGVAFSIKDCASVFRDMNLPMKHVILSGGGVKDPIWRQVITDCINMPTTTINVQDHSPFGAAILAKFAIEGFAKLPEFYERVIKTSMCASMMRCSKPIYDMHNICINTLNLPDNYERTSCN
jgi:xylulokinase